MIHVMNHQVLSFFNAKALPAFFESLSRYHGPGHLPWESQGKRPKKRFRLMCLAR